MEWKTAEKNMIWTEVVAEKISKQAGLLKKLNKPEYKMLIQYIYEIEPGDSTNREGHAAKVYFNSLFGMGFSRTAENSINAALNYGYGIILSTINREISANGYITQIGIFHDNMFNPFNLGSDLMEPFRPIVDEKVYDMMPKQFGHCEKMMLLTILEQEVFMSGKREHVNNAIKSYCKSVFDAINDKDSSLIKFYRNEL